MAGRHSGGRSRRGPEFQRGRAEFGKGPGPREIVERLREGLAEPNIIGETQLDTREGSRAVGPRALQVGALRGEHFVKDGDVYRLPAEVVVLADRIRGDFGANQLPNLGGLNGSLGPEKVPRIENLHGSLSYWALSNKPDLSRFADKEAVAGLVGPAGARKIAQEVVKNMVEKKSLK